MIENAQQKCLLFCPKFHQDQELGWDSFPFLRPGCRSCRKYQEGTRHRQSHGKQVRLGHWAASRENWRLILLKHTLNVQWAFFLADFPFFFWQTVQLSAVMLQLWSESPRAWELAGRIQAVLTSKAPSLSEHFEHQSPVGFPESPPHHALQWGTKEMKKDVVLLHVMLTLAVFCNSGWVVLGTEAHKGF